MYWRKPSERFVRPVRWLVAMLDDEIIPLEFDGVRAGNQSRGHRILADGPGCDTARGSALCGGVATGRKLSVARKEKNSFVKP